MATTNYTMGYSVQEVLDKMPCLGNSDPLYALDDIVEELGGQSIETIAKGWSYICNSSMIPLLDIYRILVVLRHAINVHTHDDCGEADSILNRLNTATLVKVLLDSTLPEVTRCRIERVLTERGCMQENSVDG